MTHSIKKSIIINRPIDEVYDTATCLESCVNWQAMMVEAKQVTPGDKGVGTQYKHKAKFMGITVETNPVITVYEPPYHFAFANTTGVFPFEAEFTFEAVEDGTRLSITLSTQGFRNVVSELTFPVLIKAASRQYENDMAILKDMMENGVKVKVW